MSAETSNNIDNRIFKSERILYVEPNNVNETINGIPLTPDYTDMCISFDLQVETVPRTGYVCGEKSKVINEDENKFETYHFYWTSYKENTNPDDNVVSFMKGEEYLDSSYLTTYYTDISLNDFGKHDIVEGLGVESITVSFESYYVPTVKMRFIDVRGASTFGRQESTHVHEKITQDSIWGCFFTFPYPKFKLQIKGFYGHPVTYQLTCTDFRANFNSKTGNFEIDVTFLGYDYGILADIPTAYIVAAPYSKYIGEDYWNQQVSTKEWQLSDGNQPETLHTILGKIKSAMRLAETTTEGNSVSDGSDGVEDANVWEKKKLLDGVINSYNNFLDYVQRNEKDSLYRFTYEDNEFYICEHQFDRCVTLRNKISHFYENVENFIENYPSESAELTYENLPYGKKITTEEGIKEKDNVDNIVNKLNENLPKVKIPLGFVSFKYPYLIYINYVKNFEKYENGVFKEVNSEAWNSIANLNKKWVIVPLGKTSTILENLAARYDSYIENKKAESLNEQDDTDSYLSRLSIYQMVGVTPTIENLFKTIMCHLETFMEMMYECKKRIDVQITAGDRTPKKLGISDFSFTDANSQTVSVNGVPPWVGVGVSERKGKNSSGVHDSVSTVGWVGEFNGETEWEEAKLIDGLAVGVFNVMDETKSVNPYDYNSTASVLSLPSDVFTDVFPSTATNNPYALGEYLGFRAAALFGVVGVNSSDAESFGKADALNLFSKIGKNALKSSFTDRNDFKTAVKNAPITPRLENDTEKVYTFDPGCEGKQGQILTQENGNYRYTYTESVTKRDNKMAPVKGARFGMVPVVIGNINSIMGTAESYATFISNRIPDSYTEVWARFISEKDGNIGNIYHNGKSEYLLANNGLTETSTDYKNDVMFNIYNGGIHQLNTEVFTKGEENLKEGSLIVGGYEDTDTTWKNALKKYWDTEYKKEDFFIKDQIYMFNDIPFSTTKRWNAFHEGIDTNLNIDNGNINIFFSPLFYAQTSIENKTRREASKCLLFLSSGGYDIEHIINVFIYKKRKYIFQKVPYGAILLLGGLLWRAQQEEECFYFKHTSYKEFPDYKKYGTYKKWLIFLSDCDKVDYQMCDLDLSKFDLNVKNKLVDEFLWFVNNKWQNICDRYEIINYKQSIEGKRVCLNYRGYIDYVNEETNTETKKKKFNDKLENTSNLFENDNDITSLDETVYITWGTLRDQSTTSDGDIIFQKETWNAYADAFCAKLIEISKTEETEPTNATPIEEKKKEIDLKLAMYMYLKRLWDRWFMNSTLEDFKVQNYMQNFVFMDSLYRNIGDALHINCEKLYNDLANINGKSMLYQLLSTITTDHNCHFFAFPDYYGFGDDNNEQERSKMSYLSPEEKIADMFKPIPFSRKAPMETSNKYVVVLVYNQNENLSDINSYKCDGFDIFSDDGNTNVLPTTFKTAAIDEELLGNATTEERRTRRYGYNIPSFGVTFGRMDNAIFKNVNINMSNPIATEQSINALSLIAEKGGGDKSVCFYGQDLYPVYNGYSYTCSIEMMGNAQIMPLMYFQLLNIPMFRGTYMIYSVTHTMRPGDMTTTFQGMKLSRNALPFAQGWYTTPRLFVTSSGGIWEDCIPSTWDTNHFTLEQMIKSDTAKSKGIDNTPSTEVCVNLHNLMLNCLEVIRDNYGKDIYVSSGYRSPELNKEVNGATESQHIKGEAADISPLSGKGDMQKLFEAAIKFGDFDQLILEAPNGKTWLHVSYRKSNRRHNVYYYDGKEYNGKKYVNIKGMSWNEINAKYSF